MPGTSEKHQPEEPAGEAVTLDTLPPADTERWVARRKAQVVAAVQAGLITLDEALARYRLTLEEFTGWQRGLYRHGLKGLQITHYRLCKLADLRGRSAGRNRRKGRGWESRHV
jgi:hypothetical protein